MQFFTKDIQSTPTEEIKQMCNVTEERYKGRKVFLISSKETTNTSKYILYFHGGSYMAGVSELHWNFLQDLSIDTNATIIVPDYPLSPKYSYKDVFNMVGPLYKEILEKIDSNNLIVMGDSAGGGIALALCEAVAQANVVQPNKTILISPWLDVRLENPKIAEIEKNDKQLNREALQLAGIAYKGNNEDSYLVNPIDGPIENLKEIIIFTGTYDILNPDVHVLEERAQKINAEKLNKSQTEVKEGISEQQNLIKIDIREYTKMPHIWLLNRNENRSEEAEKAYQDLIIEVLK